MTKLLHKYSLAHHNLIGNAKHRIDNKYIFFIMNILSSKPKHKICTRRGSEESPLHFSVFNFNNNASA